MRHKLAVLVVVLLLVLPALALASELRDFGGATAGTAIIEARDVMGPDDRGAAEVAELYLGDRVDVDLEPAQGDHVGN